MLWWVTPQGKVVCRDHNSSRTTKKRIRQVSCEDAFKMWPHKFGRIDGETEPHLNQHTNRHKDHSWWAVGLLASMTGRYVALWISCSTFADRVFSRPTDQPLAWNYCVCGQSCLPCWETEWAGQQCCLQPTITVVMPGDTEVRNDLGLPWKYVITE